MLRSRRSIEAWTLALALGGAALWAPEARAQVPFLVTLSGVPGDFIWTGTPYRFENGTGTFTIFDQGDSTFRARVVGQGRIFEFTFAAAGKRRLSPGVYDSTSHDNIFQSFRARVRGVRDDVYGPCSDQARFHVRRLTRAPNGSIRSFWATFSMACGPTADSQTGEIRYGVDTTLYVTAPGEVTRFVGNPFNFELTATDAGARPTAFTLLHGPPGAILDDHGTGSASFHWPSGSAARGLTRVVVRCANDEGVADTSIVMLRAIVPASLSLRSTPGHAALPAPVEYWNNTSALFDAASENANKDVRATLATEAGEWILLFRSTSTRPLGPGITPVTTTMQLTKNGKRCAVNTAGSFDVRKIRYAPDGSLRAFWVTFAQTCTGTLNGDLRFQADTSVYMRAPSYVATEVGRPFSFDVAAVDTRGLPVSLQATSAPPGVSVVDHGDGTAALSWPTGASATGLHPVTWVATSSDGAADTMTTTIEAFRPALFTIQGPPSDPIAAGLDLRLTAADGTLTATSFSDSAIRVTFSGGGHNLEYYFQSTWARALRQGVFTKARRFQVNEFDEPGLHVKVDDRLCNMDSASFHVRRLRRTPAGAITSLWVVFHQSCVSSPTIMSGEVRVDADTSLYIEAPHELPRTVGEPVVYAVRAVDTRGLPVTLAPLDLPLGATFTPTGPASGDLAWASTDTAGALTRITFAAMSQDGAADTVVTFVRSFPRAFLKMWSPPGDYAGQGLTYDLRPSRGALSMLASGSAVRLQSDGKLSDWQIQAANPSLPQAVGRYGNPSPSWVAVPGQPTIEVVTSGRACNNFGSYQIRRIGWNANGSLKSLWMTFVTSCGSSPGLTGEFWFDADTTFYLDGPASVFVDPGQPASFEILARKALAGDAEWSLAMSPPSGALTTTGPGSVRFDWPGTTTPGSYLVRIAASGAAGTDTITTSIHVAGPSFMSIRSGPSYLFPQGIDRKFLDRDGNLRFWRNPNGAISARFNGSGFGYSIDFSRAGEQPIVPGDYTVTGAIPPWGTSPAGIYFVWGSHLPSLTTGSYRVLEARYGPGDSLIAFHATWEMGLGNATTVLYGEIKMGGPDLPTPTQASVAEAYWSGTANVLRWYAPRVSPIAIERRAGTSEWNLLRTVVPNGTGVIAFEDSSVTRGTTYGYRLSTVSEGVLCEEVWIQVPAPLALALERVGSNPGPSPLRFSVTLPRGGPVQVELLDVAGRIVARETADHLSEGRHVIQLRGADGSPPGCYFARLRADGRSITRSVVLLR